MARRRKDGTFQAPLRLMSSVEMAEAKGYGAAVEGKKQTDNPYWQGKRKAAWERGYERKAGGRGCGA